MAEFSNRPPVGFVEPCLPTLAHAVPDGPLWVHEIKHDGYRFICRRDGDRVRLFTRRGHDWTERAPRVVKALQVFRVTSVMLDGEMVVCCANGVTDFDRLRAALTRQGSEPFRDGVDCRPIWVSDSSEHYLPTSLMNQ